ncbi:AraC family transcriptional regulator [Mesorhizobium opportunistum WSM2075]|uniref:AraC family transcriptional regulator n=1 Tax=Mesorhizobium opportunistum (strain LMG 24607 / HAMBI 3007 / WSM2075) TaxID=536019 RepID=F7Y3S0_MESOW|nr:AraC family transcriptional regulator [Mesorhizobium opportunistum WSM2075]
MTAGDPMARSGLGSHDDLLPPIGGATLGPGTYKNAPRTFYRAGGVLLSAFPRFLSRIADH